MPCLRIETNVKTDRIQLALAASQALAEAVGKPEAKVQVAVFTDVAMTHAGTDDPAAFVEVRSVGLKPADCTDLAAKLSAFIKTSIGVEPVRTYIAFHAIDPTLFAAAGKPLA